MFHLMHHDLTLVALSFLVAYFASLTALDMGTRLRKANGKARRLWLIGSAVVLGGGIWSMHFVAMLAMNAGLPVGFAPGLTLFSLVVAIAFVAIGFHVVTMRETPSIARQLVAGVIVGSGVSVMHYSGMAAMVVPGLLTYNPWLVAASVAVAVVAATAALWLTLNLRNWWQRAVAAAVMGVAVCGMHYTAMAGTSISAGPGAHDVVDPMSRIFLAAGVSVSVFLMLCLAMVCVFVDRRFELLAEREAETLRAANRHLQGEIEERQAAQRELQTANEALGVTQEAVRNLLDNADQGFLTVGPDLNVDDQSSAACVAILGRPPAGESILDLLCRDLPADDLANVRATLESLFRDSEAYMRELKLELLPTEFRLDGRSLKVSYKYLEDRDRIMLVLTDVTETARLAEAIDAERHRLEMTVLSVKESDTFWSLVADYRTFLADELPALARQFETSIPSGEVYRRIHTFKGLLAQFSFYESPRRLHEVETALAVCEAWTQAAAVQALDSSPLMQALEADLAILRDGPEAEAAPNRLIQFSRTARDLLADATASPAIRELLQSLAMAGMIEVKSTLGLYSRGVAGLAARLEKRLAPLEVAGAEVFLPPERYNAFFRSLVHVFRNAVDHGLEAPDDRLAAGKPEEGRIICAVRSRRDQLEILISDDGAGIDRAQLAAKLADSGEDHERAAGLDLGELVFRLGLSSREEAGDTSGRGVGLAAVKHELDQLGGTVVVESRAGVGTSFVFRIPVLEDVTPAQPIRLRKAAS